MINSNHEQFENRFPSHFVIPVNDLQPTGVNYSLGPHLQVSLLRFLTRSIFVTCKSKFGDLGVNKEQTPGSEQFSTKLSYNIRITVFFLVLVLYSFVCATRAKPGESTRIRIF